MQELRLRALNFVIGLGYLATPDQMFAASKTVETYLAEAAESSTAWARDQSFALADEARELVRRIDKQTGTLEACVAAVLFDAALIESYLLDTYVAPVATAPAQAPVPALSEAPPAAAVAAEPSVSV